MNYGTQKLWTQHNNKKYWEKVGLWSNRNHTAHLKVMNQRSRLTGTRDKPSIPRSTELRNTLEINQAWSPKPRLNSRTGVLTWKAKLLTLDQDHLTSFPEQWTWSKVKSVALQVSTPALEVSLGFRIQVWFTSNVVFYLCTSWAWRIVPYSRQLVYSNSYLQVGGVVSIQPLPHLFLIFLVLMLNS